MLPVIFYILRLFRSSKKIKLFRCRVKSFELFRSLFTWLVFDKIGNDSIPATQREERLRLRHVAILPDGDIRPGACFINSQESVVFITFFYCVSNTDL